MRSVRVVSSTKVDGMIRVVKEIEEDDGSLSLSLHLFHEETLEWRAAELGYDPETELDTVIDLVLYEPYFQAGYPGLYDFDDKESAKAALQSRVQLAKARLIPTNRPDRATPANLRGKIADDYISESDPIADIKSLSVIGKEEYEIKRRAIDSHIIRVKEARQKSDETPRPQASRAEQLRMRLEGNRGDGF